MVVFVSPHFLRLLVVLIRVLIGQLTCFYTPCDPSLLRNDVQSVKNALIASSLAFVPIIVLRQNTDVAPNLTSI